jgi:hypothetical protein
MITSCIKDSDQSWGVPCVGGTYVGQNLAQNSHFHTIDHISILTSILATVRIELCGDFSGDFSGDFRKVTQKQPMMPTYI